MMFSIHGLWVKNIVDYANFLHGKYANFIRMNEYIRSRFCEIPLKASCGLAEGSALSDTQAVPFFLLTYALCSWQSAYVSRKEGTA